MEERRMTLAEAARLTGRSEQALRRRIERGVLDATVERRRRYVTASALRRAGLLKPGQLTSRAGELIVRLQQLNDEMIDVTLELAMELGLPKPPPR